MSVLDDLPPAYAAAGKDLLLPYFYGNPVAWRTIPQLESVSSWRQADPECRRRHAALWIYCAVTFGVKYGFGQMARSRARALSNWQQNPAQFSHPDYSFHVEDPDRDLLPVACDNVGVGAGGTPPDGFALLRSVAHLFGLHTVSGATERHHTQLFAGSKRTWNANPQPVGRWDDWPALPGNDEEDDMTTDQSVQDIVSKNIRWLIESEEGRAQLASIMQPLIDARAADIRAEVKAQADGLNANIVANIEAAVRQIKAALPKE